MGFVVLISLCFLSCFCYADCSIQQDDDEMYQDLSNSRRLQQILDIWKSVWKQSSTGKRNKTQQINKLDKPSTSSQTTKTAKDNKKTISRKVTDLGKEKSSVVPQNISPKTENVGNKTFGSGIENKTSTSAVLETTVAKNDILNTKTRTLSGENKTPSLQEPPSSTVSGSADVQKVQADKITSTNNAATTGIVDSNSTNRQVNSPESVSPLAGNESIQHVSPVIQHQSSATSPDGQSPLKTNNGTNGSMTGKKDLINHSDGYTPNLSVEPSVGTVLSPTGKGFSWIGTNIESIAPENKISDKGPINATVQSQGAATSKYGQSNKTNKELSGTKSISTNNGQSKNKQTLPGNIQNLGNNGQFHKILKNINTKVALSSANGGISGSDKTLSQNAQTYQVKSNTSLSGTRSTFTTQESVTSSNKLSMAGTIVVDKVVESPNNVKTVTTSLSNQVGISSNADKRSGFLNKVSASQNNGLPGSSTSLNNISGVPTKVGVVDTPSKDQVVISTVTDHLNKRKLSSNQPVNSFLSNIGIQIIHNNQVIKDMGVAMTAQTISPTSMGVSRKEPVVSTDKKQLEVNTLIKPSNINTVVIKGKGFVADILSGNQIATIADNGVNLLSLSQNNKLGNGRVDLNSNQGNKGLGSPNNYKTLGIEKLLIKPKTPSKHIDSTNRNKDVVVGTTNSISAEQIEKTHSIISMAESSKANTGNIVTQEVNVDQTHAINKLSSSASGSTEPIDTHVIISDRSSLVIPTVSNSNKLADANNGNSNILNPGIVIVPTSASSKSSPMAGFILINTATDPLQGFGKTNHSEYKTASNSEEVQKTISTGLPSSASNLQILNNNVSQNTNGKNILKNVTDNVSITKSLNVSEKSTKQVPLSIKTNPSSVGLSFSPKKLQSATFSVLQKNRPADVLKVERKNTLHSSSNTKDLNKGGNEVKESKGTVTGNKTVNNVLPQTSKGPLIVKENRPVIYKESAKARRPFPPRSLRKEKVAEVASGSVVSQKAASNGQEKGHEKSDPSGMKQSITNFSNNRLLFNEFRKFKLDGKIRRRRSILSALVFTNQLMDKPVKVFSNSYDTVLGSSNTTGVKTAPTNLPRKTLQNNTFNTNVSSSATPLQTRTLAKNGYGPSTTIPPDNKSQQLNKPSTNYTNTARPQRNLKRNHKKRHINDSLFRRISKSLSNGIPVFSKKRKTSFGHSFRGPSFHKARSIDKNGLRINFKNTKQTLRRKSDILQSSRYRNKNQYLNGPVFENVVFQKMNPTDIGLHYRQRPMQIDAVINEPSLNDILPKPIPSSVTNKRLDIISTKIDQSPALTHSDHHSAALEQNQNNKQKLVLSPGDNTKHVTSSLPGSESGNILTSRNIRLSNASPFVIGNKYSTTGLSSQGTDKLSEGLPVVPQKYAGYTQQRHHDSIINMPKLLSGLSNVNDLVAENGFQDFHNRKHVNVNNKVDVNNNSPSVNDIVTDQFEKSVSSDLPNVITLSHIKIVPGGCIIDGKYYRYEDLPKFIQDFYDSKTKSEQLKLSLGDIEHVLNDYTDNKGSISQGFARDFPMLEVIRGKNISPFSIQLPGDTKGYDILVDPHLHEGSLELAVLHANNLKANDAAITDKYHDSLRDLHLKQQETISRDNDQSYHPSLKWSDGIFDKAGTGLASLSDYHLGSEVRVGSSLSLGHHALLEEKILDNQEPSDSTGYHLAFDNTRGADMLSLPSPPDMEGGNYVYQSLLNPISPNIHSVHETLSPPSEIKPTSLTNGISKHGLSQSYVSDLPSSLNMDIDTQTHLENGGLGFKDKARHHPKVLSKEASNLKTPYYGIFEASVNSLHESTPKLHQLKDAFMSKVNLEDMIPKDFSGFSLNPNSDTFNGLKVTQKGKSTKELKHSIPLELSGQYNLETIMNSFLTSPQGKGRYQIVDIFG